MKMSMEWVHAQTVQSVLIGRMAFNYGRPIIYFGQDMAKYARRLLDHPLANLTDSRLIGAVEIHQLRGGCRQIAEMLHIAEVPTDNSAAA